MTAAVGGWRFFHSGRTLLPAVRVISTTRLMAVAFAAAMLLCMPRQSLT